jgi:peptidoglycan/LPS O-acetylase OafA/YrhL
VTAEGTTGGFSARFYGVDLLRFVAAFVVVMFHYTFRGTASANVSDVGFPALGTVFRYGFLGVDLFFMISGFVIFMTALNRPPRGFVISRLVRLYPAFWACCTITFLVTLLLGAGRFRATTPQYLANMTMVPTLLRQPFVDGVYWSLLVEIKFYVMVFVLAVLGQLRHAKAYLALWLIVSMVLPSTPLRGVGQSLLLTDYACFFAAGAAMFLIRRDGPDWSKLVLLGASFIVAVIKAPLAREFPAMYHVELSRVVVAAVYAAFFVALYASAMSDLSAAKWSWCLTLGALTYPLYLLHQNVGFMTFNALHPKVNSYVLLVGVIALMLVASYAVHALVERKTSGPMRRVLERILPAAEPPAQKPPAQKPAATPA